MYVCMYVCIYIYILQYSTCFLVRERLTMGGGVVKGLILQGFASLCMSWCGYEMVMLHFKQNISNHNVILQEMCFHQWFWCLQWILHYIVVRIYYHMYIYIYIYTHHWYFLFFFTLAYVSRKVYIWYWTDMSAISSCKFCIFWKVCCILSCCSWVLFTKEHVQIEHALQQALPCWITVTHLQGNNTFCAWKRNWNFRHALPEKTAVSWTVFFLRRSFVLKTTLLSAVNCVLYLCENVNIQAHVWKIYCMLCTITAPFKADNGL